MSFYFFPAFTFAHLARWAAAIFRRADVDIVRLGRVAPAWPFEDLFAHRAFCARLIFLRAAADKVGLVPLLPVMPVRALSAASKRSRSVRSCRTICSICIAGL
jgi:hypothetical protein